MNLFPGYEDNRPRDADGRIILPRGQVIRTHNFDRVFVCKTENPRRTEGVVPGDEKCAAYTWIGSNEAIAKFYEADSLEGGKIGFEPLYIIRGWHKNHLLPGRYCSSTRKGRVTCGGKDMTVYNFDMLASKPSAVQWVEEADGNVPSGAIPSGIMEDGEVLYVGRATYQGWFVPGRVQPSEKKCFIGNKEEEIGISNYEVLCKLA